MSIKDPDRVNKILESQWVLWAISVALTCALYFYVNEREGADYITQKFTAPLIYQGAEPQVRFLDQETSVAVEVKGLEWRIARFDPATAIFYLDVQNARVGSGITSLRPVYSKGIPEGISVVSITPSHVNVKAVRESTNKIPVNFVLPKDIPQGLYVANVEMNPREVIVRGTDLDLLKVTGLEVRPTLEELQSGKEVTLPVQLVPRGIAFEEGGVTVEPSNVQLRGMLASGLPKKSVPVKVRRIGRLDEDHEIIDYIVNPIEVQIEGDEELLSKVWSVETETVDLSVVSPDLETVVPLLKPDIEGVSLTDVDSVQLTFHFTESKAGRELTNVPVAVRNEVSGTYWTVEPAVVTVSVEGIPSKIKNITIENAGINAFVDLSDVFMNTISLPVSADIASDDFKIVKIEPSLVTVVADRSHERRARERMEMAEANPRRSMPAPLGMGVAAEEYDKANDSQDGGTDNEAEED